MFEIPPAEMLHNEESNTAMDPTHAMIRYLYRFYNTSTGTHTQRNATGKEKYTMLLGITKVSLRCTEIPYH